MLPLLLTLACTTPDPEGAARDNTAATEALRAKYPWESPTGGPPAVDEATAQSLPQGLVKFELGPGAGEPPQPGAMVALHFNLWRADTGELVDSSAVAGRPVQVMLGQGRLLEAWEAGLPTMRPGERALFRVPSELGYKKYGTFEGRVPPHTDLVIEFWLISASAGQ